MINIEFTVCSSITGEILRTGTIPQAEYSDILLQARSNEVVFGIKYDQKRQYLSDIGMSIFSAKPDIGALPNKTNCLADDTDTITISGLPIPCHIVVTGPVNDVYDEASGTVSYTFDFPGTYKFVLSAVNKLDQEIIVNAA